MSNPSQTSQTRRRLDAGETRRGEAPRISPTGHRSRRRWALRLRNDEARWVVAVGGASADYGGDGKDDIGDRSTAMGGRGAAARGERTEVLGST